MHIKKLYAIKMTLTKTIGYLAISLIIVAFITIIIYLISHDSMDTSILYFLSFLLSSGFGASIITLRVVGKIKSYHGFPAHFSAVMNVYISILAIKSIMNEGNYNTAMFILFLFPFTIGLFLFIRIFKEIRTVYDRSANSL